MWFSPLNRNLKICCKEYSPVFLLDGLYYAKCLRKMIRACQQKPLTLPPDAEIAALILIWKAFYCGVSLRSLRKMFLPGIARFTEHP
jgi:hypothetical protein